VTPQQQRLPQPLEDALEEIRIATAELIAAASQENPARFMRSLAKTAPAKAR